MDQDEQFNKASTAIHSDYSSDNIDPSREQLVKDMCAEVKADKAHHDKAFKRIKDNMKFVRDATTKEEYRTGKKYVADIVGHHLDQKVAKLYAKNPEATYNRRPRRNFQYWDEDPQTIENILKGMAPQGPGLPPTPLDPQSEQILNDFINGMAMEKMFSGMGDTLVKTFNYYLDEQKPKFKSQMKQMVRRALICSVGYLKIGYQREMQRRSSYQAQLDDVTLKLENIQRLQEDIQEGDVMPEDSEIESLRLQQQAIMDDPDAMEVIREGLVFDFPKATAIIPARDTEQLAGFVNGSRVTHEIMLPAAEIQKKYGIKLSPGKFTAYEKKGSGSNESYKSVSSSSVNSSLNRMFGCVWEIYDKNTGLVYTCLEGYCDFLEEPGTPNVEVEGFYPIYALVFGGIEDEDEIYPKSDARKFMPIQDAWNQNREGLKEHRLAARPRYAMMKGMLDKEDKTAIMSLPAHHTIELNIPQDKKLEDVFGEIPHSGVDNNLYDTSPYVQDMQMSMGANETALGAISDQTATAVQGAASSNMTATDSNIDDMDDFLSEIARDGGQILMLNMSKDKVIEIVGPGAVWPDLQQNRAIVVKELYLEVRAGSSGKANKTIEIANFERLSPILQAIPGLNKNAILREAIKRLDDKLDPDDFIDNSLSIVASNAMKMMPNGEIAQPPAQPGAMPPGGDPNVAPAQAGPPGTMPPEEQAANGAMNMPGQNNFDAPPGSIAPMGANNL